MIQIDMGITQAFKLGKNQEKENYPCPPVIIIFTTTDMVETVLIAARGGGLGDRGQIQLGDGRDATLIAA